MSEDQIARLVSAANPEFIIDPFTLIILIGFGIALSTLYLWTSIASKKIKAHKKEKKKAEQDASSLASTDQAES